MNLSLLYIFSSLLYSVLKYITFDQKHWNDYQDQNERRVTNKSHLKMLQSHLLVWRSPQQGYSVHSTGNWNRVWYCKLKKRGIPSLMRSETQGLDLGELLAGRIINMLPFRWRMPLWVWPQFSLFLSYTFGEVLVYVDLRAPKYFFLS